VSRAEWAVVILLAICITFTFLVSASTWGPPTKHITKVTLTELVERVEVIKNNQDIIWDMNKAIEKQIRALGKNQEFIFKIWNKHNEGSIIMIEDWPNPFEKD